MVHPAFRPVPCRGRQAPTIRSADRQQRHRRERQPELSTRFQAGPTAGEPSRCNRAFDLWSFHGKLRYAVPSHNQRLAAPVVQTAGTVSQSNPSGWYNAGTAVTVTASPGATFLFAGFSGVFTGMQNLRPFPRFRAQLRSRVFRAHNLEGHQLFSPLSQLLEDALHWDQFNLGPTVDSDLAALSQAGFNMIHLYVWDQAVFQGVTLSQPVCGTNDAPTTLCFQGLNPNEPAGFIGPDGDRPCRRIISGHIWRTSSQSP